MTSLFDDYADALQLVTWSWQGGRPAHHAVGPASRAKLVPAADEVEAQARSRRDRDGDDAQAQP